MRNALQHKIHKNKSGIVNLDNVNKPGTHWVAYTKRSIRATYFVTFKNLQPKEVVLYLGIDIAIIYNRTTYQT